MSRMELTSLLNTSGAGRRLPSISEQRADGLVDPAVSQLQTPLRRPSEPSQQQQQQQQHARPMHRSRTPWDGNGYSLSVAQSSAGSKPGVAVDTMEPQPQQQQPQQQYHCRSPSSSSTNNIIMTSPRHRISDSRDSRSSFSSAYTAASDSSMSHSRLSSLSTVSEHQPLPSLTLNFKCLDPQADSHHNYTYPQHPYPHHSQQQQNPSPPASRHALHTEMLVDESQARLQRLDLRAQSTSYEDKCAEADRSAKYSQTYRNQMASSSRLGPALVSHKRAASAPDYRPNSGSSSGFHRPTFGPIPEPTPSPSQHSDANMDRLSQTATPDEDQPSPSKDAVGHMPSKDAVGHMPSMSQSSSHGGHGSHGSHESHASISSISSNESPSHDHIDFEAEPTCLYREDCDTGSQMRKAISHIFGRNKICTRSIPAGVWVHYCRKHYQRTRYRNGGDYPRRQIVLVQIQIHRVQAWSNLNARKGHGPILNAWLLGVRKREQQRMERSAAGQKRSYDDDEAEDEYHGVHGHGHGNSNGSGHNEANSSTAVPDWMVPLIKATFTTSQILDFVARLRTEIEQGILTQIPDIEILPMIEGGSSDGNAKPISPSTTSGKKKSNHNKSTHSASADHAHRRAQSVSMAAMRSDSMRHDVVGAHRSSQSVSYHMPPRHMPPSSAYAEYPAMPVEKRQRTESVSESQGHGYSDQYSSTHWRHAHERNHSMSSVPAHAAPPPPHHAPAPHGYPVLPAPLQAPNPLRPVDRSVAQRLEEAWPSVDHHHHPHDHRGAWTHQRSHSEAVYPRHHGMHRPTASFTDSGSTEVDPRDAAEYVPRPRHHDGLSAPAGHSASSSRSGPTQLPGLRDLEAMQPDLPAHYHSLPEIKTANL